MVNVARGNKRTTVVVQPSREEALGASSSSSSSFIPFFPSRLGALYDHLFISSSSSLFVIIIWQVLEGDPNNWPTQLLRMDKSLEL